MKDETAPEVVDDRRADIVKAIESASAEPAEPQATPEPEEPSEKPAVEAKEGKPRDEAGKFAPKAKEAPATQQAAPKAAPAPVEAKPAESAAPPIKAPQSWKPNVREEWGKLPRSVQEEVSRRERETAQVLAGAAEHRKVAEALTPFEGIFRAEGVETAQGIRNLMQSVQALQQGSPQRKAQLIASMCNVYNVPIDLLDKALVGGQQPAQQGQPQQLDPQQILQMAEQRVMDRLQRERGTSIEQAGVSAVQQFEANEPEFLDDVREDMAALMESAARRGVAMDLQSAYDRACLINPDIAPIVRQREQAKSAGTGATATQRAKAAASSIRSAPTGSVAQPSGDDRKDAIRAALRQHSR